MSAFDRLSRMCGPQVPPELLAELAAFAAEVRAEDIALIEDRACDADFTEEPLFIEGLRSAADLLKNASPAAAPVPVPSAGAVYREVWDAGLPPGGLVCSVCGQPVESEPCPDHAPSTPVKTAGETGGGLSPEREAEIRAARYTNRTTSPAAADIAIDDLLDELGRLRAELAELTARARRVAVSHEHFIQDHDDPGTEALAAQYELINHLSRSADPGDLPLNPVETALRVVLAVLDEAQDDASPREIRGAIADALPREDMSDHRHRIYIDGRGDAWMDVSVEADGTTYIAQIEKSFSVGTPMAEVAERTGSLREIGRCL